MSELTLDQKRAQYAWECTREVARDLMKEYTSLAKAVPSLIMNSGLMQTLAFLQAKAKDEEHKEHKELLRHICEWLGRTLRDRPLTNNRRFPNEKGAKFESVMQALHNSPSGLYMRATSETMALLRWIRQFADARKAMEG